MCRSRLVPLGGEHAAQLVPDVARRLGGVQVGRAVAAVALVHHVAQRRAVRHRRPVAERLRTHRPPGLSALA